MKKKMIGRNFKEISKTYSDLASYEETGYPILQSIEALETRLKREHNDAQAKIMKRVAQLTEKGATLHAALQKMSFPKLDVAIIRVGEQSGKLVDTFKMLSRFYQDRYQLQRSLKSSLFKPARLILLTLILNELAPLVSGQINGFQFFLLTFGIFGSLVGMIYFGYRAWKILGRPIPRWLPLIGKLTWIRQTEGLFNCLKLGVQSGCDMLETLSLTESVIQTNPKLTQALRSIRANFEKDGLAAAFAATNQFEHDQIQAIQVGEATGRLEDTLEKICGELQTEVQRLTRKIEDWLPKIIYGVAVAYSAYKVLGFYSDHLKFLDSIN